MKQVVWDWSKDDPRNSIGKSVLTGRDSLFRNRAIEHVRVGDKDHFYTLTRWIPRVKHGGAA